MTDRRIEDCPVLSNKWKEFYTQDSGTRWKWKHLSQNYKQLIITTHSGSLKM